MRNVHLRTVPITDIYICSVIFCLLILAFNTIVILAPKEIMTKKNSESSQHVSF